MRSSGGKGEGEENIGSNIKEVFGNWPERIR